MSRSLIPGPEYKSKWVLAPAEGGYLQDLLDLWQLCRIEPQNLNNKMIITYYFRYLKSIMKKIKKALLIQLSGDSETPCIAKLINGAA